MIFEVTPEQIEQLSDSDLRTLVGRLAEQELVKQGFSASAITYGGHQNAPDGGIDVRADLEVGESTGYVPRRQTGFQVKAEDFPRSAILREMRPEQELRDSIKRLAELDGAYIIVSSKGSLADTPLNDRREAMRDALADIPETSQLHVDFYDRQRLASWVNQNPGLVPWVRQRSGLPLSGWQSFNNWSSSPGAEDEEYFVDEHFRLRMPGNIHGDSGIVEGINQIREILNQSGGAVRLVGLSGVGKTSLVQALFDAQVGSDSLSPNFAVYADLADEPNPVPLVLLEHLQNCEQGAILIIDNCGIELHRKLVSRIERSTGLVSLITVEYDITDDVSQNTEVFHLEPASNKIIERVISRRHSHLSQPEIKTITDFSEGNFRIALAIAETARRGESLANLNDSELFERLFKQRKKDDPALLCAARICSLVYSFDGETLEEDAAEITVLAELAEQSVSKLHSHIAELHRRKLLQKRSKWRAILPHALAHRLGKQGLQDIPRQKILNAFTKEAPERLLKSFSRRLGYLHDSSEARMIVDEWLGNGGFLSAIENLSGLGLELLTNIAPVSPSVTLDCLVESAERDPNLFERSHHERFLVPLLRELAYEGHEFGRAVHLISGFTGTGVDSNNDGAAINVFKSLFMLYLSGTQAEGKVRARTIMEFAQTGGERNGKLALAALSNMLKTDHFSSSYSFDFGTRKRDYGYQPKTGQDIADWFLSALEMSLKISELPHLRTQVRHLVAERLPSLFLKTGMTDEIIAIVDRFAAGEGWPEGWLAARSTLARLPESDRLEDAEKIQVLVDRLQPRTLKDRIASYISPRSWSTLDVVDADFTDEARRKAAEAAANKVAHDIGRELAEDADLLEAHLPDLAKAQSQRVVTVMRSIAEHAPNILGTWKLVRSVSLAMGQDARSDIVSAFVGGVAKHNRKAAEAILDEALCDQALHPRFINMQIAAGMNDRGMARTLTAAKTPTVPTYSFSSLAHTVKWKKRSGKDLRDILQLIMQRNDGLPVAVDIMNARVHGTKIQLRQSEITVAKEIVLKALSADSEDIQGYYLANITRASLGETSDEEFATQLCDLLFTAVSRYRLYPSNYREFTSVLAKNFPIAVLNGLLQSVSGKRQLPGQICELNPIKNIDQSVLVRWAGGDKENRLLCVAQVVPLWKVPAGEKASVIDSIETDEPVQWTEQAKRLIKEVKDKNRLLNVFVARFYPDGWSGSRAAILEKRASLLEELCSDSDEHVAATAEGILQTFRESIQEQRDKEEREDRARDERFEW